MHKEIFADIKELFILDAQFHECLKLWCYEHGYRGMRRVHMYNQKHDYKRMIKLDEFILNQPYDFKVIKFEEYPKLNKFEIASYKEMLEIYANNEKKTIAKLKDYAGKLRQENDFTGFSFVYEILEEIEKEYNKILITIKEFNNFGWTPEIMYIKEKQIHDKMKEK